MESFGEGCSINCDQLPDREQCLKCIDDFELYLKEKCPQVVEALLAVDEDIIASKESAKRSIESSRMRLKALHENSTPLQRLKSWTEKNKIVCAVIRDKNGSRRELTGKLIACDSHWNMALRDVLENYYRPKSVRIFLHSTSASASEVPTEMRYEHANKVTANLELVKRRIHFLMVKGSTVELVYTKRRSEEEHIQRAKLLVKSNST
ncbi:LSM domain containing protein [Trichuris trichiura]|uniref:LSM domain containing protein n=1 Tax=Trichuris trichiura TaxID=36087 RepID=A0A077ZHR3_TRITR|nr:LSM domain containing protein [Trichuris trichiura]